MLAQQILQQAIDDSRACHKQATDAVQEGCRKLTRIVGDFAYTIGDLHEEMDTQAKLEEEKK